MSSKLVLDIHCPWGTRKEARFWVDPNMTYKNFVNQVLLSLQLDVVNGEDGKPAISFAKLVDGKKQPFECKWDQETLGRLGIKHEDKIFIMKIERKGEEAGTTVVSSVTDNDTEEHPGPAAHSTVEWNEEAPDWRQHGLGLNYEANCPTDPSRRIILHRGYGAFDWVDDPVGIVCLCCKEKVDPRTVTRCAVNNCIWKYEGVTDAGKSESSSGTVGNSVYWLPTEENQWRKLRLSVVQPN